MPSSAVSRSERILPICPKCWRSWEDGEPTFLAQKGDCFECPKCSFTRKRKKLLNNHKKILKITQGLSDKNGWADLESVLLQSHKKGIHIVKASNLEVALETEGYLDRKKGFVKVVEGI